MTEAEYINWAALREVQKREREQEKRGIGGQYCTNCLTQCPPTRAHGECLVCSVLRSYDKDEHKRVYQEAHQ
jgi:hypothetical protein